MKFNHIEEPAYKLRELEMQNSSSLSAEDFNYYYTTENYETFFIEYVGDISAVLANIGYAHVYIIQKFFAILFVEKGMLNALIEKVPEIIGVQQNFIYTLSELTINNEISSASDFYNHNISFNGEDVIVGIIGTGIDFLNPRFITETGESRVVAIWDQTINTGPSPELFPFGVEYKRDTITEAIKTRDKGGSPYEIVPHKDETGHGTALAGIIGGKNLGDGDTLKSIAPNCEFAIVKLDDIKRSTLESVGIDRNTKNVYQGPAIASAINYLYDLQSKLKKPMVVYLPVGSNFGGRDGGSILERFIDSLTQRRDFSVVTNTGNQGKGETHTSGIIEVTGVEKDILINIGKSQSSLSVTIYIRRPDVMHFSITSPSGESITRIPIPTIKEQNKYLTFKKNDINIRYFAQERATGAVNINIMFQNTYEGVWKISLFGESIVNGLYDSWLLQLELLKEGTRFLNPDPKTTLLTPCVATNIISTSYYNQVENNVIESAGKGFPRNGTHEPSLTIGGVNLLTVGLNDSLVLGTGAAMAGAILAGAVALIYQWGIVQGNFTNLSPPRLKNLIIAGTVKEEDKIYPNDELGFGKLSFEVLQEVLLKTSNNTRNNKNSGEDEATGGLYINIPIELYKYLKKYSLLL
jgi:subtilisin family serine protease